MKLYHVQTPESLSVVTASSVFDAQVYALRRECRGKNVPVRIEEVTAETFEEVTAKMVLSPELVDYLQGI